MEMAQLARDAQLEPITRESMIQILAHPVPATLPAACDRFSRWIRTRMVLINEPVEMLHRPEWMLQEIAQGRPVWGDCDDAALLAATLTLAAGLEVRLVAALAPEFTGEGHVYAEVRGQGAAWYRLDPTTKEIVPADWPRLIEDV